MATRKPDNARVRTTPTRAAAPSTRRPKPVTPDSPPRERERARPRPEVKPVIGIQESWRHRIDPARVALAAVLIALLLCVALLVDVYLGRNDPVHVIMVTAFGPLAFLVPVGVGVLVLDFYRRYSGRSVGTHRAHEGDHARIYQYGRYDGPYDDGLASSSHAA
ncbi:MAG: hypothetical protein LC769_13550 [Chloroflexi bacterium]|nr:hypothetical protein [Chloroflexota bacterium]